MTRFPHLDRCVLCGTCSCVPSDEDLIKHQGAIDNHDFICEDQIAWLRRIRLIVGIPTKDGVYPQAATEHAHLTGTVRYRTDTELRWQFTRGTAIELNFGVGTKHIRGEEQDELISVPRRALIERDIRQRLYFIIHEQCLSILGEAGSWERRTSDSEPITEVCPRLVDQFLRRWPKVAEIHCDNISAWESRLDDDDDDDDIGMKAPKSYFCEPLSQLHISRLRPFLVMRQDLGSSHDKFNDHLDQWQRALLLVPKSYHGDPFYGLPTEILMHITSFLSAREIRKFCLASGTTAWKLNQAGVWLNRIRKDMPWLWDVTRDTVLKEQALAFGYSCSEKVDWQAIYFDLREQSIYDSRKRNFGLVNRKRIWNTCLGILEDIAKIEDSDQVEDH